MRIKESDENDSPPEMTDQVLDFTRSSYQRFARYVEFRRDDPIWMLLYKIVIRIIGIAFFILISPLVLISLIIAFLAVL